MWDDTNKWKNLPRRRRAVRNNKERMLVGLQRVESSAVSFPLISQANFLSGAI